MIKQWIVALCTASAFYAPSVLAEEQQPIPRHARMLLPSCDTLPFDPAEVESILRVELLSEGISLTSAPAEGDETLIILDSPGCRSEPSAVVVRVERSGPGQEVSRVVEIEQGTDSNRIVALAIAELVRARWPAPPEEEPEEAPTNQPELPPPAAEDLLSERERHAVVALLDQRAAARQRPPAPRLGFTVDVAVDGRLLPAFRTGLVGARIGTSVPLGRAPLRLDVDGAAWYGLGIDPLGYLDVAAVAAGLTILWSNTSPRIPTAIGIKGEVGGAWARGRPFDSETGHGTASGFVAAVLLRGCLRVHLRGRAWMLFDGQVGYVISPLEAGADGRRAGGVGGVAVGLNLGLSFEVGPARSHR